jgi:hypothetical protein
MTAVAHNHLPSAVCSTVTKCQQQSFDVVHRICSSDNCYSRTTLHSAHTVTQSLLALCTNIPNRGLVLQGNSGTWSGAPTWNGARIVPSSLVPPPPVGSSVPVGGRTALLVDEVSLLQPH